MSRLIAWLVRIFTKHAAERPPGAWLIDRDGRVYKPERKIVLKAKG